MAWFSYIMKKARLAVLFYVKITRAKHEVPLDKKKKTCYYQRACLKLNNSIEITGGENELLAVDSVGVFKRT